MLVDLSHAVGSYLHEVFIAKFPETPDKDSETTILLRHADARLTMGSLEAMGRGYTCGREEPEQERETREESDQPYFDMHW